MLNVKEVDDVVIVNLRKSLTKQEIKDLAITIAKATKAPLLKFYVDGILFSTVRGKLVRK